LSRHAATDFSSIVPAATAAAFLRTAPRTLPDRLTELEAKQDSFTARLSNGPPNVPDIHPNISEAYRRRIEQLTEALSHPDDALEAADAIREVIDRIVITPGQRRGENHVTLQGDLATILEWIERTGKPGYKPATDIASSRLSVSVKTRARPGHPRLSCLDSAKTWMPGTPSAKTRFCPGTTTAWNVTPAGTRKLSRTA
jgi:hypothetical protein